MLAENLLNVLMAALFDPEVGASLRYHTPKTGNILIEVGFFSNSSQLQKYAEFIHRGRAARWIASWEDLPGPRQRRIIRITVKDGTSEGIRRIDQGRACMLHTLQVVLLPLSLLDRPFWTSPPTMLEEFEAWRPGIREGGSAESSHPAPVISRSKKWAREGHGPPGPPTPPRRDATDSASTGPPAPVIPRSKKRARKKHGTPEHPM